MDGAVPIESSYTGRSGSGFGCLGAGRVMYAFVTTGTLTNRCWAYEGGRWACGTLGSDIGGGV